MVGNIHQKTHRSEKDRAIFLAFLTFKHRRRTLEKLVILGSWEVNDENVVDEFEIFPCELQDIGVTGYVAKFYHDIDDGVPLDNWDLEVALGPEDVVAQDFVYQHLDYENGHRFGLLDGVRSHSLGSLQN